MTTPDISVVLTLLTLIITRAKKLSSHFTLNPLNDGDAERMCKYIAGQLTFMETDKEKYRPREREWMGDLNHILFSMKQMYDYVAGFKDSTKVENVDDPMPVSITTTPTPTVNIPEKQTESPPTSNEETAPQKKGGRPKKVKDELSPISVDETPKKGGRSKKVGDEPPTEPSVNTSVDSPKNSSYNDFYKIIHPMIKAQNPSWSPQEITTEIGRQWSLIKSGASQESVPVKEDDEPKEPKEPKESKKTSRPKKTKEESSTKADDATPVKVEELPPSKPEETPKKTGRSKKVKEESPEPPKETVSTAPAPVTVEAQDEPLHLKRKKIPKAIRTLVWNKYIGADITAAKCLCCREEKISHTNWHCGHVHSEAKGGDSTINNLRPICAPCNSSMGTKSMNEFMEEYFGRTL